MKQPTESLMRKTWTAMDWMICMTALVTTCASHTQAEGAKPATKPARVEATEVRTYDLGELLRPIPNYELPDQAELQSQSGRGGGGGGGGGGGLFGGQAQG